MSVNLIGNLLKIYYIRPSLPSSTESREHDLTFLDDRYQLSINFKMMIRTRAKVCQAIPPK